MASDTAGKWLLGLVIYFFIMITIVTYASNMNSDVTYSGGTLPTEKETYCDSPRVMYDQNFDLINNPYVNTKECESTLGIYSQNACEFINGCIWDNVTTGFLWWTDTIVTCTGDVNTSYYNNGTTTSRVCNMQDADNISSGLCSMLGCTPYVESSIQQGNKQGVFDTIYEMATFQVDVGLPDAYEYLFSFVFFYLPLIILILAGLMYIPLT